MQCFCGNILSVNARNSVFRYLVEHNGRIESMGNQLPEQYRNMQAAVDFLAGRGIGCVHTVSGVGFVGNLDISMEKNFARSWRDPEPRFCPLVGP